MKKNVTFRKNDWKFCLSVLAVSMQIFTGLVSILSETNKYHYYYFDQPSDLRTNKHLVIKI